MRRRDSSCGAERAANGNRIPSIWSRPRLLMMMSASRRSCSVAAAVGDEDGGIEVCGADAEDVKWTVEAAAAAAVGAGL